MKLKIKATKSHGAGFYWTVYKDGNRTHYPTYEAAYEYVKKQTKRMLKEAAAFSRACEIAHNTLSCDELAFVRKMLACKCKGITKAQYGWLAGIYERQQKEW